LAFVHGLVMVERLASTAATAATATTIATATGAIVPLPFLIIVIVTRMARGSPPISAPPASTTRGSRAG
ncbi:MAG: hypothetical protein AAF360_18500, partial [Pseudomonadota bacterium]